jgi:putative phosphoribosyl transferase
MPRFNFVLFVAQKIVIFLDRTDAGRHLAARLTHYADRSDMLELALPRGGVPVAFEVAKQPGAPLVSW